MWAEPTAGGDIHLVAITSFDGASIFVTPVAGVTFFVDQNGNNQWDSSTDIDLGIGTMTSADVYEKTITPQAGWNLTWLTASAFDVRVSGDKFGPNHSTVLRSDASPPVAVLSNIISGPGNTTFQFTSDESVRFVMGFNAPATMVGATLFLDRNQNGLFDSGIDTPLSQKFSTAGLINGSVDFDQDLGQLGFGWQSLGLAIHDASTRGNDSWSAVTTAWIFINNTPWVSTSVVSPAPVPVGTQTIDLTFNVRDDGGVQGVRNSFVDINGNGGFAETGEPQGTNLTFLTPGRSNATWRLTFFVGNLPQGNYAINLWLRDYTGVNGPRSVVSFSIV